MKILADISLENVDAIYSFRRKLYDAGKLCRLRTIYMNRVVSFFSHLLKQVLRDNREQPIRVVVCQYIESQPPMLAIKIASPQQFTISLIGGELFDKIDAFNEEHSFAAEFFLELSEYQSNLFIENSAELLDLFKHKSRQVLLSELETNNARLQNHSKELEIQVTKRTQQLEAAITQADSANQAKGDFLANMSHEIRTPMNAIIGMSHLVLETELGRKQRNYIEKVHLSAESLLGIINDILDFSKIEAGKLDIEQTPFRLVNVMDNLANLISFKADEKEIELLFDIAPDVPDFLIGDPLRLGQILINLANNAVKFTETGQIIVKVEAKSSSAQDVELLISVIDSGIGMTEKQQENLFQSFSQADTSTTRKYGGTGLGLTISKRLAQIMGGDIWVTSEKDVGSTFVFTICLGISDAQENKREFSQPRAELKDLKVLAVDDNAMANEILASLLSSLGFDVVSVNSGQKAVDLIEVDKQQFDLAIIDWKMPGLDGISTAKKIKQLIDTPIIMLTAASLSDVTDNAQIESLLSCVLSKPVSASSLHNAIMDTFGYEVEHHSQRKQVSSDKLDAEIASLAGANILLVEDNELNQELAMDLLTAKGITVTLAENGLKAYNLVKSTPFDGVLMDCQMPVMDGFEATENIRKLGKEYATLPILAMTANVMESDRQRVMKAGMNAHIGKPIRVQEMFSTMAKWITPSAPTDSLICENREDCANVMLELEEKLATITLLDIKIGLFNTQNNADLYQRLLTRFLTSQRDFMTEFNGYYQQQEFSICTRLAHTLKGLAATIGCVQLEPPADELESASMVSDTTRIDAAQARVAPILSELIIQLDTFMLDKTPPPSSKKTTQSKGKVIELLATIEHCCDEFDVNTQDHVDELLTFELGPELLSLTSQLSKLLSEYAFDESIELIHKITDLVKNDND